MTSTPQRQHVAIVGAGPAGLALACALADAGLGVRVLEQQPLAALESPADDGREIAITHRSRRVMERLGLWDAIPADAIAPLREACVLDGERTQALRFEPGAGQSGPLGWLLPNHRIRAAALHAVTKRPSIRLQCGARVTALALGPHRASVTLEGGERIDSALVVAADSRFSNTRRLAGIGASLRDFGRSVVVACMAHERPHHGSAWECFRYGNTLALLPMNGDRSSVVITVPADEAPRWLAMPEDEFSRRVTAQAGGRLGAMTLAGERHHYPLVGVYAHRFAAQRIALVGDAAVGMHPVTAHGWNFGLYGVEVLAREVGAALLRGRDIGDRAVLEAFERQHRRATGPIYRGTNALVALFTDERPAARLARQAVIDMSTRVPVLNGLVQKLVRRQLTGGLPATLQTPEEMTP